MQPSIFEPSSIPSEVPSYKSTNTAFVAALLSADLATYLGASIENGRVAFSVSDRSGQCAELERQFARGIFTRVNPHLLFEARSYLQSEVLRVKPVNGGRYEQVL